MTYQLYRHFDSDGCLLYVGISLYSIARLQQHRRLSSWVKHIARVEIQECADRAHALRAEKRALREEAPFFNIKGNDFWAPDVTAAQKYEAYLGSLEFDPEDYDDYYESEAIFQHAALSEDDHRETEPD